MKNDDVTSKNLPTYKKAMVQVVAYKRIRNAVNQVLKSFELNTTQWMILGMLYETTPGLRVSDVARTLEVEVPLITRLAQSLVAAGFAVNKADKTDKRAKLLQLTDGGSQLVTKVERELTAQTQLLEEGLSDRDVNGYFRTLMAFASNADTV